ncbi:ABC transporter ATP-binding protein [Streptomyces sp. VRA16 Mangrove soil]|uniref:dipeptide ABC transporter ATP-binding protein n=1 Tax=Streptomyces sp. VRA16 Mangrove soil TaxID=2817434 RepID=UPI001A9F1716|nr:ABC transporter ATP-binding protein [Streptomyces sp. VRA16 Mangrove soil]MBO1330087.1 ABC transporter ATP-binding protein [Streptomyces sp. VRA16 Mangrove soil]
MTAPVPAEATSGGGAPPGPPTLRIRGLSVVYRAAGRDVTAVDRVDLDLAAGETVAVVGASGSGKSTLAGCVNRLLAENARITQGSVRLGDLELTSAPEKVLRQVRGARVGMVPQDPMTNLDPVATVGAQIAEALTVHGRARGRAARDEAAALLARAGIDDAASRCAQYPHEFSGGMRQRVLIAMALACRPDVLVADEPTSALDVTVQRLVLDQMAELTREMGTSVLLITHDLALAAERADRVVVLHEGRVVETGPARAIIAEARHPYTRRLVAAAPGIARPKIAPVPRPTGHEDPAPLLELREVSKEYRVRGRRDPLRAVDGVSLSVLPGRTVALVGESGSGKSTTARIALRLEDCDAGAAYFDATDITRTRGRRLLPFRRAVQPVFQNPYASLDPRHTVARIVAEPLRVHGVGDGRAGHRAAVERLLDQVALPAGYADRYPHELSGGQRQRVALARALALGPRLIVLDEAVSALDVLVQDQILDLMVDLQRELGLGYLFISHDLDVVRLVAHHVLVMRRGRVVEEGVPEAIFERPGHPYTRALIDAIPGSGARGACGPRRPPW